MYAYVTMSSPYLSFGPMFFSFGVHKFENGKMKRDSIVHIIVHIISDLKVSPGSISGPSWPYSGDLQALVEMSNGNCSVSKEGNGIKKCVLVTTWRIPKMDAPKSSIYRILHKAAGRDPLMP